MVVLLLGSSTGANAAREPHVQLKGAVVPALTPPPRANAKEYNRTLAEKLDKLRAQVRNQPDNASAHYELASALTPPSRTEWRITAHSIPWDERAEHYWRFIELAPEDRRAPQVRHILRIYGDRKQIDEPAKVWVQALDLRIQAEQQIAQHRIELACSTLRHAVALYAMDAESHYLLAHCHLRAGQSAEAADEFKRFHELAPDDPRQASDHPLPSFSDDSLPAGVDEARQLAHQISLAVARDGTAPASQATAELNRALSLNPDDVDANYLLGRYSIEAQQSDQATVHFRLFVDLAPDDSRAPSVRAALASYEQNGSY
jgi:tetratricopeptide (TPR) repeat protein